LPNPAANPCILTYYFDNVHDTLDYFLRHVMTSITFGMALVAGLLGLVRYRRLGPGLRGVALLALFDALMESIVSVLANFLHTNNLFMAPLVAVGEIALAALAYQWALQSAAFSRVLPWLLGLFSAYALAGSVLWVSDTRYLVPLETIANLIQLSLAGLYFHKLLSELQVKRLQADPFFWLSIGLALYGLGNLFISLSSNYVLAHCSMRLQEIIFWGIRNVFNIQLYLAYCVALVLRPPRAQLPGA
jgi:hypothetical protein